MSPNTKQNGNGRGGMTELDLLKIKVVALEKSVMDQNTLLVNLSAMAHEVNRMIPIESIAPGKLLLHGTADILAKADLPAAISYIPEEG